VLGLSTHESWKRHKRLGVSAQQAVWLQERFGKVWFQRIVDYYKFFLCTVQKRSTRGRRKGFYQKGQKWGSRQRERTMVEDLRTSTGHGKGGAKSGIGGEKRRYSNVVLNITLRKAKARCKEKKEVLPDFGRANWP